MYLSLNAKANDSERLNGAKRPKRASCHEKLFRHAAKKAFFLESPTGVDVMITL
jgi:hypothetical protein